jgi:hypothetical protein
MKDWLYDSVRVVHGVPADRFRKLPREPEMIIQGLRSLSVFIFRSLSRPYNGFEITGHESVRANHSLIFRGGTASRGGEVGNSNEESTPSLPEATSRVRRDSSRDALKRGLEANVFRARRKVRLASRGFRNYRNRETNEMDVCAVACEPRDANELRW